MKKITTDDTDKDAREGKNLTAKDTKKKDGIPLCSSCSSWFLFFLFVCAVREVYFSSTFPLLFPSSIAEKFHSGKVVNILPVVLTA
jgi:hypothetical protein